MGGVRVSRVIHLFCYFDSPFNLNTVIVLLPRLRLTDLIAFNLIVFLGVVLFFIGHLERILLYIVRNDRVMIDVMPTRSLGSLTVYNLCHVVRVRYLTSFQ